MDNCFLIVNKIAKNKAKDHISLSYDERFLRRKKLVSDNGFEFLVNLPETKSLSENQAFRLQSGNLILIKNKKETLLEIKGKNLMQLIWHIGNRHMPCQIEKDRIFIQYDEVIKKMNDNQYGLSSGIYTSNLGKAMRVSKAVRAGIVFVNTYRLISPSAPFGGIKDSGYGKEAGIESIKEYTRIKTTWFNSSDKPMGDPFTMG